MLPSFLSQMQSKTSSSFYHHHHHHHHHVLCHRKKLVIGQFLAQEWRWKGGVQEGTNTANKPRRNT